MSKAILSFDPRGHRPRGGHCRHSPVRAGFPRRDQEARAWRAHGERILSNISKFMPGVKGATYDRLTLGFRPMPEDGLPVVGAVPGSPDVYVTTTHSGVTLAPILGRHVTQEILTDTLVPALSPYRPARFLRS